MGPEGQRFRSTVFIKTEKQTKHRFSRSRTAIEPPFLEQDVPLLSLPSVPPPVDVSHFSEYPYSTGDFYEG